MKLCFFNGGKFGLVEQGEVLDVSSVLREIPASGYPFPREDLLISRFSEILPFLLESRKSAERFRLSDVEFESPVKNPGKIIAAPVNYQAHLEEAIADTETFSRPHVRKIQETGLFLKATSSLVGVGDGVHLSLPERRTDHEVELVAVIGRRAKNVKSSDALDYVFGYSIGLDITIRGPEERSLRKSLDTYTVLGPWLVTKDEIPNPQELEMSLSVNGGVRQAAHTKDMILQVSELIEFASRFYTLEPGDLIYTGTPEGVGPISGGDSISCKIERVGEFDVKVFD